MKVSCVDEMRALDQQAIDRFGLTPEILMENAGGAVYSVISQECGVVAKRVAVFCGAGNNGGDGFVVARKLHSTGADVEVFLLSQPGQLRGAAKTNFEIIAKMPLPIVLVETAEQVKDAILRADIIVDAMFGTGLTRDVGGIYRDVIHLINHHGKTVFSVDIPSGVDGDSGMVRGIAVNANYTITFGLPKRGNLLYPGYALGGKLYVSHISFPPPHYDADTIKVELFHPLRLAERLADTHKGDYGKALFIAGSSQYLGAPYFAALSFLKAGGGLSYLATPQSIAPFIVSKGSEIVCLPQPETEAGSLALESEDGLVGFSEKVDVVVLGPGVSLNDETQRLVTRLTTMIRKPLLIDGDGLTAISTSLDGLKQRKAQTMLTPHLGEMARLTKRTIEDIKRNRIDVLQRTAHELDAIIVLKEAHSLTGYPDGRVVINTSGNPGMATAGSGDVLTGTIAAMHGLGVSLEDAVPLGVFMHGLAGDLAAEAIGEDGITAQDILEHLPYALASYREDFDQICQDFYGSLHVV
jgi:hydroxyethylthiazole kinase-like uncharacterized protein yjeF